MYRDAYPCDDESFGAAPVVKTTGVLEPAASEYQMLKTRLHRELVESIDLSGLATFSEAELKSHVKELAHAMLAEQRGLTYVPSDETLVEELLAESFGLGPLEPYLNDPEVSDILVNGPNEVYVERRGKLQNTNTVFADERHLMQIIHRVVGRVGRRIDEQSPMVDARLADGSRVHAVVPPLALNGPVLSIRRFGSRPLVLEDLLAHNSISPQIVTLLRAAVEGKLNIMISGGAGAGKTTLLNALSRFIPAGERLVTIEDSAELLLQRKHVVRLETRTRNSEGEGEVTQRELVRNSLRMRPDRIILGEVRGPEALDMLQAMNTGHEGSLTTIHANGTSDALSRLEVMVSMAGGEMPMHVVRRYVASAVTLLVHVARLKGGLRKVTRVSELVGLKDGDYHVRDLFRFQSQGLDEEGRAKGCFLATGLSPNFLDRLFEQGIELSSDLFAAGEI